MELTHEHYYRGLLARDRRFDGVFYVGVTSTKIYCRPICPAKTPKENHCRFYKSAAEAESQGFRPCLKCRPELAPGLAPVDASKRLAKCALYMIQDQENEDNRSIATIANSLGISSRHLRRILQTEYGVSPIELAKTHRLLTAKRLLTETDVSLTEIAFASGFQSIRSFNHLFKKQYGMSPSKLRSQTNKKNIAEIKLKLTYRPPIAWDEMITYFKERSIKGVEMVRDNQYFRTVKINNHKGWLKVYKKEEQIYLECAPELLPVLSTLVGKVNNLFDLDCHPELIIEHLSQDRKLSKLVKAKPGLRIPGSFDEFETCIRAIAGQLVSVKSATNITGKFVDAFGERIKTPYPELDRIAPTPEIVSSIEEDQIASKGFTRIKAIALKGLAERLKNNEINLRYAISPELLFEQLSEIKGIGPWTANYLAMRILRDPDAFPAEDLGVKKALNLKNKKEIVEAAKSWQPWRAYAAIYLWHSLG